ncbi:Uncharacterised protein g4831 [Pycnogonum litorale]
MGVFLLHLTSILQRNPKGSEHSRSIKSSLKFYFTKVNSSTKWIILETSNKLTEDETYVLSSYSKWISLVISDENDDKNQRYDNVVVLNTNNLNRVLKIQNPAAKLPPIKTKRINQAYLIAMQAGATHIFDASEYFLKYEQIHLEEISSQDLDTFLQPRMVDPSYDPMDHYGSYLTKVKTSEVFKYKIISSRYPAVNKIMVSSTRLLDSYRSTGIPKQIILPSGQLSFASELNTVGTLFRFEAFYGLVQMPYSHSLSISDIYRTLLIQNLLEVQGNQQYGYRILFSNIYYPIKYHIDDEDKLNIQRIVKALSNSKCESGTLDICLKQFVRSILQANSWTDDTIAEYLDWWIESLKDLNYFDKIMSKSTNNISVLADNIAYRAPLYTPEYVRFENETNSAVLTRNHFLGRLKNICPHVDINQIDVEMPWTSYNDILLLITYNVAASRTIPLLNLLYGYKFPNLMFCAPDEPNAQSVVKNESISYMPTPQFKQMPTSTITNCFVNVARMKYRVTGFLHASDDVILNPWNLKNYDRSKIWTTDDVRRQPIIADAVTKLKYNLDLHEAGQIPQWVTKFDCDRGVIQSFDDMRASKKASVQNCYNRLLDLLKKPYRYYYGQGDIFYVPSHLTAAFADVMEIFVKNIVFFEISVPTVLRCISDGDFVFLPWNHIDVGLRTKITTQNFKNNLGKPYIHPWKFSAFIGDKDLRKNTFCNSMIPEHFSR